MGNFQQTEEHIIDTGNELKTISPVMNVMCDDSKHHINEQLPTNLQCELNMNTENDAHNSNDNHEALEITLILIIHLITQRTTITLTQI